jgi:peptidoglycan/xylan/chitin deacetylase (PgdA/CDA1 family)
LICLSVDNLGGIAEGQPPDPAHPALAIGVPRLLALFAECGLETTFFVEGYAAEVFTDASTQIRDAGHELGLHAWKHEAWGELEPDREAELLGRGLEAFDRNLGLRPRGFRPPGGKLTGTSAALFARHGLEYVSTSRGNERGLRGVPFDWKRVDAFALIERFGGRQVPERYFADWTHEALAHQARSPDEPWLVVVHPFCAGMDPHFAAFARFVREVAKALGPRAFRTLGSLFPIAPAGDVAN